MFVSNENVISARLLSGNYSGCVPRTSLEHVSLLIYKICEYIRQNPAMFNFPNTYVEQTSEILGQNWSEFIDEVNNKWDCCPKPLRATDALIFGGFYRKFLSEFVIDREKCEKIESLIASCPYLLVVDDGLCVTNDRKQMLTTHIELLNMNKHVAAIFSTKVALLGLQIENRNIKIQCIARRQMFHLKNLLGRMPLTSINYEGSLLLSNQTKNADCSCSIL